MRPFASSAALLAFAVSASAYDISTPSDQDGSVWASLNGKQGFSIARRSNRPFKRQSGWNPPSELTTPLQQVWDHQVETYSQGLFGFKNYGWDQLIAAQGTVNICVRWESSASVTEAQRAQVAEAAQRSYAKWFEWLYGFDNFPYTDIPVKVTGWAVRDTSLLQGSTDGIDVYTDTDSEGAPQCATACGRFFNQNGDYSRCPGGAESRYDQTLWLTDGFRGGAGGDWGSRVGREYFMDSIAQENIHIYLHEIGHTFGLDDFYDWTPSGVSSFVMLAGSASQITDFDGWMLRNWWYELSRDRDWQSAAAAPAPAPAPTTTAPAPVAPVTTAAPVAPTSAPVVVPDPVPVPAPTQPVEEEIEEDTDETIDDGAEEDIEEDDEEDLEAPCPVSPPVSSPVTPPVSDADTGVEAAGQWGQCGGLVWTGPKACAAGLTCTEINPYYSQCL